MSEELTLLGGSFNGSELWVACTSGPRRMKGDNYGNDNLGNPLNRTAASGVRD